MSRIMTAFERLLDAAHAQATVLERAPDPTLMRALGAHLSRTIERIDRFAVLLVVQTSSKQPSRTWDMACQRWLADRLDDLHGRTEPLLRRVPPEGELRAQRFATRLSARDPLARFRAPDGIADVAGKLITGMALGDALRYLERERGTVGDPEAVIASVSLRDADLPMACLSAARMLDLDARGVSLNEASAPEARLSRVDLTGASMRAVDLRAALARDCNFSEASMINVRWHDGTAVLCSFARAALAGLRADRAMFLHCDFRGADLTVGDGGASATMTGAQFLDCDLRWSRWDNRTLRSVRFLGCKLHGVIGTPSFEGVVIDNPDLSPTGDGSRTGSLADVLALWRTPAAELLLNEALRESAS
jgi:uncharacterized protein YjbI with pentapeptide repeats